MVTDPPPISTEGDGVIRLADVYSAVGYYLKHEAEIEEYLQNRLALADETRLNNEIRFPATGVRERLIGESPWEAAYSVIE